jgi:acetoin:2,6-dichlorophenolindophenol oxidoreductase subunit beta
MDQIANQAAKLRYMSGGQLTVPLVIRAAQGAGRSSAAQHSQTLHALFAHIPGLKVALPATPYDAKGLLVSAIRDPNPVLILEDKMEYGRRGEVPEELYEVPFGVAAIRRKGTDVTLVATSSMVHVALEAAETLESEGVSAAVVDPRTLVPLDVEGIVAAVIETGRAIVIDEGPRSYGAGAEIAAAIAEHAFDYLEAPVQRIGAMDVPVPFAPALERATIPDPNDIVTAVQEMGL